MVTESQKYNHTTVMYARGLMARGQSRMECLSKVHEESHKDGM